MNNEITWSIDHTHSEISFKARHLMISHVKGSFKKFDASIRTTGNDFTTAAVDLWIDASSLNTGDFNRDDHLKSKDFLDVQNHKQINFTSSTIEKSDDKGNYELWGELTIKGITQNIKLNVSFGGMLTDPWANEKAGFTITGSFNRSDWGLVWNMLIEAGGMMVGEEITIACELELINTTNKESTLEVEPDVYEVRL